MSILSWQGDTVRFFFLPFLLYSVKSFISHWKTLLYILYAYNIVDITTHILYVCVSYTVVVLYQFPLATSKRYNIEYTVNYTNPWCTPYQLCRNGTIWWILLCAPLMDILDFIVCLGKWTDQGNEQIVRVLAIQHDPLQQSPALIPCTSPFKFRHSQMHR